MKNRGFTLIELLVYVGLFSILMVGFLSAAVALVEGGGNDTARAVLNAEGLFILQKVQYDITNAIPVRVPQTDSSIIVTNFNVTKVPSTILTNDTNVGVSFTLTMHADNGRSLQRNFFSTTTISHE